MKDVLDFTFILLRSVVLSSVFCTLCCFAAAQDDSAMREARLYFDAGDFVRAASQYKSMIDESLPPWQKDIITYNYGTVLLAQGRWEEALAAYDSITINTNTPLFLLQNLKTNFALAQLLSANSQQQTLEENAKSTLDDYNILIIHYREALDAIEAAKEISCRLSKAEGAEQCEEDANLIEMRLEAKRQLAKLLHNFLNKMLTNANLQEDGFALLTSVKTMLQHLDFLMNTPKDSDSKLNYQALFLQEDTSWRPLWKAIESSLEKKSTKEQQDLFQKAESAFSDGIASMERGDYIQSKKAIEIAVSSLESLLQLVFEEKSLKDTVQRVLSHYTLVLYREHIQLSQLQGLIENQSRIEMILKENDNPALKELYKLSQNNLNLANDSLNQYKQIQARMYVEEARYYIKHMLQILRGPPKNDPEFVLKNAIADQELALKLNQLRASFESQDSNNEVDNLLVNSQSRTVANAKDFFNTVILRQEHGFHDENKSQKNPWDEVLPRFIHGFQEAKQAKKQLDASQRKSSMASQEQTIKAWKEALKELQAKKKTEEKKEEKQQPAQPEPQPLQQPEGTTTNDVLRLLQQMENEDKSKPQMIETPIKKDVERPW